MPNATLGVRRRVEGQRDSHNSPLPAGWGTLVGPAPGYLNEQADGTWRIGLDPQLWPVRQGDMVIDGDTGGAWLIDTADLLTNSEDPTVDWVRLAARQRGNGGTEPGGAWFVNRYAVDIPPPVETAGLWTGHGPPTDETVADAQVGDEYIDLDTGVIYQLGPD